MKPDRIVLDSNVIISALLFGGPPQQVLQRVVDGRVECFISLPILDEIRDVLRRPKFGFDDAQAMAIVEQLRDVCDVVTPRLSLNVVHADADDNRILECAAEADADFIVSGDSHLLDLRAWKRIHVLSPAAYLELRPET